MSFFFDPTKSTRMNSRSCSILSSLDGTWAFQIERKKNSRVDVQIQQLRPVEWSPLTDKSTDARQRQMNVVRDNFFDFVGWEKAGYIYSLKLLVYSLIDDNKGMNSVGVVGQNHPRQR